jgi:hypothetical protein
LPGVEIVTSSLPLVDFVPVQVPDAVHEVALVEDQVKVTTVSINTDEEDAERDEVGLGSEGVGDPPPPPPPPPQLARINVEARNRVEKPFICINLIHILF